MANTRNIGDVNCADIKISQLILAIYNDFQYKNLPRDQAIYPSDDGYNEAMKLAESEPLKFVDKIMGKIDVNLDFSKWPILDATVFDKHIEETREKLRDVLGQKFTNLESNVIDGIYKKLERKKLEEIVNGIRAKDKHLINPIAKEKEGEIKQRAYHFLDNCTAPEKTTVEAVAFILNDDPFSPRYAVEYGGGKGRDTLYLLKMGFNVITIDVSKRNAKVLRKLQSQLKEGQKLIVIQKRFDEVNLEVDVKEWNEEWKNKKLNFFSSWSLPYAGSKFKTVFASIAEKIGKKGRFAGQFFGEKNFGKAGETAALKDVKEVEDLLKENGLEVESVLDVRENTETQDGNSVPIQTFHVRAIKR